MKAPASVLKAKATASMLWKQHGATIMTLGGVICTVAGTITACKATLKVDDILNKRADDKKRIEDVHNGIIVLPEGSTYTEKDYKKDILVVKTQTAKDLVKLYWPSALLIGGGIGMILSGHHMMHRRVAAAATSAALLQKQMDQYRTRVRDTLGAEEEKALYSGVVKKEVEEIATDEKGKPKIEKKTQYLGPDKPSPYARYFDETNPYWTGREDTDFLFIKQRQAEANHLFWINGGYLFWNSQLEMLGFEPTVAGQVAGNRSSTDGTTDNYIDFGIFDPNNGTVLPWALEMYRREHRILVNFNLDGNILDKVKLEDI